MSGPITELLAAARRGDAAAQDALTRAVYAELRTLAAAYLRRERDDHTWQPIAVSTVYAARDCLRTVDLAMTPCRGVRVRPPRTAESAGRSFGSRSNEER